MRENSVPSFDHGKKTLGRDNTGRWHRKAVGREERFRISWRLQVLPKRGSQAFLLLLQPHKQFNNTDPLKSIVEAPDDYRIPKADNFRVNRLKLSQRLEALAGGRPSEEEPEWPNVNRRHHHHHHDPHNAPVPLFVPLTPISSAMTSHWTHLRSRIDMDHLHEKAMDWIMSLHPPDRTTTQKDQ